MSHLSPLNSIVLPQHSYVRSRQSRNNNVRVLGYKSQFDIEMQFLQDFDFVMLTDRYDESLILLKYSKLADWERVSGAKLVGHCWLQLQSDTENL